MTEPASLTEAVARAVTRLTAAGLSDADARLDAAVLARHVLGWDLATWLGHQRDPVPASFAPAFDAAITRRATREPVAYITGTREFYGRAFHVTADVLIPRPETELLVERALAAVAGLDAPSIIDIGTGSGAIAITLAAERPSARVRATDVSAGALSVARGNASRLGVAGRVTFAQGPYLAGAPDRWDLIVSNPPYVAEASRSTLSPDVVDHEPHLALFADADGLACIREIVRLAPAHLALRGWLLFEFGFGQADAVRGLLAATPGLTLVELVPDLQGIPRVAIARTAHPAR